MTEGTPAHKATPPPPKTKAPSPPILVTSSSSSDSESDDGASEFSSDDEASLSEGKLVHFFRQLGGGSNQAAQRQLREVIKSKECSTHVHLASAVVHGSDIQSSTKLDPADKGTDTAVMCSNLTGSILALIAVLLASHRWTERSKGYFTLAFLTQLLEISLSTQWSTFSLGERLVFVISLLLCFSHDKFPASGKSKRVSIDKRLALALNKAYVLPVYENIYPRVREAIVCLGYGPLLNANKPVTPATASYAPAPATGYNRPAAHVHDTNTPAHVEHVDDRSAALGGASPFQCVQCGDEVLPGTPHFVSTDSCTMSSAACVDIHGCPAEWFVSPRPYETIRRGGVRFYKKAGRFVGCITQASGRIRPERWEEYKLKVQQSLPADQAALYSAFLSQPSLPGRRGPNGRRGAAPQ